MSILVTASTQKFHTYDVSASDWLKTNFPRGMTNQKRYPDLGSETSSVWNFCARYSDVIFVAYSGLGPLHMNPVDRTNPVTATNFALGSYEKFQPGFRDEKRPKNLGTSSYAKFEKQSKHSETQQL